MLTSGRRPRARARCRALIAAAASAAGTCWSQSGSRWPHGIEHSSCRLRRALHGKELQPGIWEVGGQRRRQPRAPAPAAPTGASGRPRVRQQVPSASRSTRSDPATTARATSCRPTPAASSTRFTSTRSTYARAYLRLPLHARASGDAGVSDGRGTWSERHVGGLSHPPGIAQVTGGAT